MHLTKKDVVHPPDVNIVFFQWKKYHRKQIESVFQSNIIQPGAWMNIRHGLVFFSKPLIENKRVCASKIDLLFVVQLEQHTHNQWTWCFLLSRKYIVEH